MLGDEKRQISGEAFHYFNVEELIPANHILRRIDAVLDLSWVRDELRDCYAERGRKSWDPEVIVRMILLGYLYGFSEVRLVDELWMHMGYRCFCLLQPSDKIPDRTTLVKLRNERWRQDLWVKILEKTVQQCVEAGLVSGRHVSVDGTRIRADERPVPGQRVLGARLVEIDKGQRTIQARRQERTRNTALRATRTPGYRISRLLWLRVEYSIGEAKVCHGMGRARHRGEAKVNAQVMVTSAVMNLKRLAKTLGRQHGVATAMQPFGFARKDALRRHIRNLKRLLNGLVSAQCHRLIPLSKEV